MSKLFATGREFATIKTEAYNCCLMAFEMLERRKNEIFF